MAICRKCNKYFYGERCPHCDWKAEYSCFCCGALIDISKDEHCVNCGWFICPFCNSCSCNRHTDKPSDRLTDWKSKIKERCKFKINDRCKIKDENCNILICPIINKIN